MYQPSRRGQRHAFYFTYWHIDDALIGTTSIELSDDFFKDYTKSFPMKPLELVKDTRSSPEFVLLYTTPTRG